MLIELLDIELFDLLTVCVYKMFTNHIFNIYVQTEFGIK